MSKRVLHTYRLSPDDHYDAGAPRPARRRATASNGRAAEVKRAGRCEQNVVVVEVVRFLQNVAVLL